MFLSAGMKGFTAVYLQIYGFDRGGVFQFINKSRKKERINQIQDRIKNKKVIPGCLFSGTARNNPGSKGKSKIRV